MCTASIPLDNTPNARLKRVLQPSTHLDLDLPSGRRSGRAPTTGHMDLTLSFVWQWTRQTGRGCHAAGREKSAWHT